MMKMTVYIALNLHQPGDDKRDGLCKCMLPIDLREDIQRPSSNIVIIG